MSNNAPVAIVAQVKEVVSTDLCTLVWRGLVFKARLLSSIGLSVVAGDIVIAESLPASSEYYVVAQVV